MSSPERLLAEIVAVTEALGVRALVAAGWARFGLDASLPDYVMLVDGHLDHAEVLPRCSAAVHHGGSSTTAAVAAAGLPSVVVSVLLDQSFWGSRVENAGVGVTFPFRRWSASRVERALATVLGDQHRERAAGLAHAVTGEDGATRTAELIESGR